MDKNIEGILAEYVAGVKRIFGNHLKTVILYGSYARGDYNDDSDIDIMILLDVSDFDAKNYLNSLVDLTYDINDKYDTDIMPMMKNKAEFSHWIPAYPFYVNVDKEGVRLYDAA